MAKRTPEHNEAIRQALLARGVGASPTKVCRTCRRDLPRATAYRTRANGFTRADCLECERAEARERGRNRSPEQRARDAASNRRTQFQKKYGITVEEFEAMVADQAGRCLICSNEGPGIANREFMFIDHDHKTGRVRGLLCFRCNTGLGMFQDDPEILRAAIDYLKGSS